MLAKNALKKPLSAAVSHRVSAAVSHRVSAAHRRVIGLRAGLHSKFWSSLVATVTERSWSRTRGLHSSRVVGSSPGVTENPSCREAAR
ncbi:hypothetical protein TNCV_1721741 [Trichonephila clavipes]|nr:hypothetical protein TNCV_1721741 [Trichonephila clavipes]